MQTQTQTQRTAGQRIVKALYTWAIPGYWYQLENGEKEFSAYGEELTQDQKDIVNSFPCNCFKSI